ncbi:MAG: peroxidase-related enzyme [Casimicrobiaceae bacterium]|nr:peroxidase-related enzyme [Casimicrobiaceae bacterium]MDW8312930.1 peroxidase-related enzyme [Burkholderiales bacterium]
MAGAISRFAVLELDQVEPDIRARMLEVQAKAGFIPNVFLALAHRPAEFRAFFAYHDALMNKESARLGKAEREMIVVATSGRNKCLYCVVAHGALLRIYSKQPHLADQLAVNPARAQITPAQRAMLDFALKVCSESAQVDEADFARLREHGFTDEDIWDIGAISAFFAMSNRLANMAAIVPNAEFYLMGRLPKAARSDTA